MRYIACSIFLDQSVNSRILLHHLWCCNESCHTAYDVVTTAGNIMTNQSIYVIILLSFCKQNDQNEITNPLIGQGIGLSIILLLSFCKQNDQNERAMYRSVISFWSFCLQNESKMMMEIDWLVKTRLITTPQPM